MINYLNTRVQAGSSFWCQNFSSKAIRSMNKSSVLPFELALGMVNTTKSAHWHPPNLDLRVVFVWPSQMKGAILLVEKNFFFRVAARSWTVALLTGHLISNTPTFLPEVVSSVTRPSKLAARKPWLYETSKPLSSTFTLMPSPAFCIIYAFRAIGSRRKPWLWG